MESYRQYCPVAKAHEILGDRWTMLIVRELVGGRDTFNDIARGLPGISRSLLTDRLRRLEQKGVLSRTADKPSRSRYRLTDAGQDLKVVVEALGKWGARWAFDQPDEADLDPGLLLWRMRHRLAIDALPHGRVVVQFDFRLGAKGMFWFVIEDGKASVCVTDPGFEIDLDVQADLSSFYQVWLGRKTLTGALEAEEIIVEGSPKLKAAFSSWFLWSPMSRFVREAHLARV